MAIYDNNGSTNAEIGKVHDDDGTTNHQIGKVYDNDGTTDRLIYSAVTPITVVPNASGYPSSKYSEFTSGSQIYDNALTVSATQVKINGNLKNSYAGYFVPITLDGHSKFNISAINEQRSDGKASNAVIKLCTEKSVDSISKGIGCNTTDANINSSYDISSLGGSAYLFMGNYGGQSSTSRSYLYINSLTLTE